MTDGDDSGVPPDDPAAGDPAAPPPPPAIRTWPRGRLLTPAEALDATCGRCGAPWQVHKSMGGFRLRCDCGGWVAIARDRSEPALLADAAAIDRLRDADDPSPAQPIVRRDERGLVHLQVERGDVYDAPIPTSLPMGPGALQSGKVEWRARWTNVAALEIASVLTAILLPQVIVLLLVEGREETLLMPFASMVGGVAALLIAAYSGPYGTIGMRMPPLRHAAEALVAPFVGLAYAAGWCYVLFAAMPELADQSPLRDLKDQLGPELAVFTVAVMPAIVEEISFRGMLQGRLMALLGYGQGLVVTAMAFTLVHLSPATMPIHLGLGLYLGWLRERSASLWPGIFVHFAYNTLVLFVLD